MATEEEEEEEQSTEDEEEEEQTKQTLDRLYQKNYKAYCGIQNLLMKVTQNMVCARETRKGLYLQANIRRSKHGATPQAAGNKRQSW